MARQLIESLATDFEPDKYRDEYRERVLDLIERKAEGQEIAIAAAPEAPKAVPDLMAALEASLAAAKGGKQKLEAAGSNGARRRRTAPAKKAPAKKPAPSRRPEEAQGQVARLSAKAQGGKGRRGRGRGPPAQALEPRQGLLPGGRLHQGPGDRLLPADRPGAAAAPARPPADAEALSGRRRGPVLLREAVPVLPARLDQDRRGPEQARGSTYCLANDLSTLVWLANLADLELHTSLSQRQRT